MESWDEGATRGPDGDEWRTHRVSTPPGRRVGGRSGMVAAGRIEPGPGEVVSLRCRRPGLRVTRQSYCGPPSHSNGCQI